MSITCVGFSHVGSYPAAHIAALIFAATMCMSFIACLLLTTETGRSKSQKRWSFPECEVDHQAGLYFVGPFFVLRAS